MKIMRFIILLVAVAYSQQCDNPDGAGAAAFAVSACDNASDILAAGSTACANSGACTPAECCTPSIAGSAISATKGTECASGLVHDQDGNCANTCTAGYENGTTTTICAAKTKTDFEDPNSTDATSATTLTFGTPLTVNCKTGWGNAAHDATSYTVSLNDDGTNVTTTGPCAALEGVWVAGDAGAQGTGGSGAAAGITLTFGSDITVVCTNGWGVGGTSNGYTGVVTATADGVTGGPCAKQACIAGTTGQFDGTSNAEEITCAGAGSTHAVSGDAGACACDAVFEWAGEANSDFATAANLVADAATVVNCLAGFSVDQATSDTDFTVVTADGVTFTKDPATATCTANVWDIPAQTIANTNFAAYDPSDANTDAIEITFEAGATPTGVAITCNTGWFDAAGDAAKLVVDNAGNVSTAFAGCTQCTAIDSTDPVNVVPTGWVVPDNATGTAGTWGCTEAAKSGFSAWTCDSGFNNTADAAVCAADTTATTTTTTAAPSSADGSDVSPAFIAGTAIAGIALLL